MGSFMSAEKDHAIATRILLLCEQVLRGLQATGHGVRCLSLL